MPMTQLFRFLIVVAISSISCRRQHVLKLQHAWHYAGEVVGPHSHPLTAEKCRAGCVGDGECGVAMYFAEVSVCVAHRPVCACPADATVVADKCYKLVEGSLGWQAAAEDCAGRHMQLLAIGTAQEQQHVEKLIAAQGAACTHIYTSGWSGNGTPWQWNTTALLSPLVTYTNWGPGHPANDTTEGVIAVLASPGKAQYTWAEVGVWPLFGEAFCHVCECAKPGCG